MSLPGIPDAARQTSLADNAAPPWWRLGGAFFAYPPLCPHMAEPLEISGVCDGTVLTCTKHLWQWDMRSGNPLGMAERELLLYPVKTEGADVLVDLEKELVYSYED